MSTRVYLPGDWQGVDEMVAVARMWREQGEDPSPVSLSGHAVTPALREALPQLDDEELEHYAMTEAAQESLQHFRDEKEPMRRLVLVVEVTEIDPEADSLTRVLPVGVVVPDSVVAWLVDTEDAAEAVREAVLARGSEDPAAAEQAGERLLDHELAWFAATELDEVLALE